MAVVETHQPASETARRTKRAFIYLRVSSEGQVNTDYSRDGLSITAQREAAQDKAAQLNAEIVGQYSDPGRSAFVDLHKRTDFLAMLDELRRRNERPGTRVDYVIVWALNRWARNQLDHWQTREMVREAGARLISITEPMIGEDTPESFYMEGMFALNNQYESMKTGRNVRNGLYQKAKGGGTVGWTRLGYRNTLDVLPDGRRIPAVAHDPERQHFLTLGFQLYDSGEYSISQLVEELYRLGLRSRPTKRTPGCKVGTSAWQRILRDPYYAGWIVWKRGTSEEEWFEGRHEALVDQDLFDRVQARLDEQRVAGDRPQFHRPYLRGSIFCGECGQRFAYGESRGRNGRKYPYFFCVSRVNGGACTMRTNIRPELIEQAIQRYYRERPVEIPVGDSANRAAAIESLAAVSQQAVVQVRDAKTALITKLQTQQQRLLRLHLEGDEASPDAFRSERARLQDEIHAAEESLAETESRLQIETSELRMALELAEDVAAVYASADEATKRGYNQAFFQKIYVMPEWDYEDRRTIATVTGADLTEPYAALLASNLTAGVLAETAALTSGNSEDGPEEPSSAGAGVSYFVKMAEGEGFEPSMDSRPCWFSRPVHSTALPPLRASGKTMLAARTSSRTSL